MLKIRAGVEPSARPHRFADIQTRVESMAMSFPYSFFSCPCTDGATSATIPGASEEQADEEEEEKTFNPKSQRTNFSLYPLDHLMWCEDCHDIKCSRCTVEEIVCWYCPSCLFEVPSSTVKSEGNR